MARTGANLDLFAGHLIPLIGNYSPDIAALRRSPTRIVVGVGDESTPEQMTYQASYALAAELGEPPVAFPGGHGGFDSHPDGFAATLREVLAHRSS
jgi:pimeloyl-ACP methyl ester carboxylesterase